MVKKINKRGWIRIVEAMIAVLLLIGFAFILLDTNSDRTDSTSKIYSVENAMLRQIQLNSTYRDYVLNSNNLPIEYENYDANLKNHISITTPNYLNCTSKICFSVDICEKDNLPEKDIYVRSVIISANENKYSSRQIKLFCWTV